MQNQSISNEFCLENNHKIGCFYRLLFGKVYTPKLPRNSHEIGQFFREFVPKNPPKFDFFFHDLSEALALWVNSTTTSRKGPLNLCIWGGWLWGFDCIIILLSWDICCGFNNHHAIVEPRRVKYSIWS